VFAAEIANLDQPPRLIVLSACHGSDTLAAVGPLLARFGIPAVVAMQERISIAGVHAALPQLLQSLESDGRIDFPDAASRK
jgi:hypothetical protein